MLPGRSQGLGTVAFSLETTWHVVGNRYIFYSSLWKVSGKRTEHLPKGEKGSCGRAETDSHLAVADTGGDLDPTSLWASSVLICKMVRRHFFASSLRSGGVETSMVVCHGI